MDIMDRLRAPRSTHVSGVEWVLSAERDMRAAADEIAALRADVARLKERERYLVAAAFLADAEEDRGKLHSWFAEQYRYLRKWEAMDKCPKCFKAMCPRCVHDAWIATADACLAALEAERALDEAEAADAHSLWRAGVEERIAREAGDE